MIQNINLGAAANDKTGDSARSGGDKINKNFAYLESKIDNGSALLSETGFTLTGQDLTMNTGWNWMIAGVNYTNPADVIINIPFAATGLQRIDLIVLNTSNTFTRVPGIESADNPVAAALPANTVQATIIVVTDGAVDQPAAPITGDAYVAKSEFAFIKVNGSGAKAAVTISSEAASFRFVDADSIASISVAANNKKFLYSGKKHFIKNDRTSGTLIILNNSGTGNYKYFFANGQNLVLQPGEIAEFMVRFANGNNGFLDYVGVAGGATDISGKEDTTNKSQTIETDKASTSKYGSVKAFYDWAVALFQLKLVSGTNIKTINETSLLGSGNITITAGSAADVISYALSAPTGNLTTGDVDTFHAPYNFTLTNYWIGVKTPPTISSLLVDVKKSGVSITSTKAGIDATEFTSLTGTTPVLTTTTFVKGDVITPVISQIGSGDTGISLKIYLEVIKT